MPACPQCNSKYIHRSKSRGIFELSVLTLVPIRPFRCEDCDRRFYWFASATDSAQAPGTSRCGVSRRCSTELLRRGDGARPHGDDSDPDKYQTQNEAAVGGRKISVVS